MVKPLEDKKTTHGVNPLHYCKLWSSRKKNLFDLISWWMEPGMWHVVGTGSHNNHTNGGGHGGGIRGRSTFGLVRSSAEYVVCLPVCSSFCSLTRWAREFSSNRQTLTAKITHLWVIFWAHFLILLALGYISPAAKPLSLLLVVGESGDLDIMTVRKHR